MIHTHIRTHTLSLIHSLIHSFIVVACACCDVFSARMCVRSLLSVSLPLPPFLIRFSLRFYLLCFLPLLSFACFLAVFLSLVRFLSFSIPGSHDFNSKQSCSHCKSTLSLSCPWYFLSDGTVEEKNGGRDKLMRKGRDLLEPATYKCLTYYRTHLTVVAHYKLEALQYVAHYKRFSLIAGSRLLYIYMGIYIFICEYV